jgi:hypothetical protein
MDTRHVRLVDRSHAVLAVARVADEGGYFGGTIDLHSTPADLRALFEEFEEIVNGQMFVFLDEIQEKIGALPIRAVFDDGSEASIKDLQVFPSTGDVSFRLAGMPSPC